MAAQPEGAPGGADTAIIRIDASSNEGPFKPVWNWFGHDEPNYTYMPYGRKLLIDLAELSAGPVYIRTHNLLTSGNGAPALKWGSTNAYSEDSNGSPVYDWTILDRIFDAYRDAGITPFVEIGFMPQALSRQPEPYQHQWPTGPLAAGWAYPPKDYDRWGELVYQWARHVLERYGSTEVANWIWEIWNEPDISYWQGSRDEFYRLYDVSVEALRRAIPGARIAGPHSTGAAASYLLEFLEHCHSGRNHATGATGAPLDFIAFHPKGSTRMADGHARMSIRDHLSAVASNLEAIASNPEWRALPIILGESDPEGCAACAVHTHPQNAYRETSQYGAYTAATLNGILELAGRYGCTLEGIVTWAFEFEDQPYFAGLRELATHGIAKPVLNVFRMLGRMHGNRLAASSSGALSIDELLETGVCSRPDIGVLAAHADGEFSALVWNYHDDTVPAPEAAITLEITGLHAGARRLIVHHYRVDDRHSAAFRVWQEQGSPLQPTPAQHTLLQAASELAELHGPKTIDVTSGQARLEFGLPRQGVSLISLRPIVE
jgi:xylan 1,4-beta-xylosidase